ncbi:MAG: deoxyribodipyrimidine photo-lyase [Chloroflexi bacterium]|nr:deoxyribodipyrimidine photo-lyase [Chloroflexota bacterium]
MARGLAADGVAFLEHPGLLVHGPDAVLTRDGRPYTVFSPYRRTWDAAPRRPILAVPTRLPAPPRGLPDRRVPSGDELGIEGPTARPGSILPAAKRPRAPASRGGSTPGSRRMPTRGIRSPRRTAPRA